MCYEFESWHWKARAKEMHKAQSKPAAVERKDELDKAAQQPARTATETKPAEKVPA